MSVSPVNLSAVALAGVEPAGGGVARSASELAPPAPAFESLLSSAIEGVNERLHAGEVGAAEFAAGRRDDIHGTMLALSEAEIELKFAGNVKNKVIDAFNELWRMQV